MSATRLLSRTFRTIVYASPRRPYSSSAPIPPTAGDATPTAAAAASPSPAPIETVLRLRVDPASIPEGLARALSLENASRSDVRRVRKMRLIERFRRSESDTGSPEVQNRIRDLTEHVQQHKQDAANRRSLVMLVHKRRRLMKYLLRESSERYVEIVKALALRPSSVFSKDVSLGAKKAPTPKLH